jgi:hypothetical protein
MAKKKTGTKRREADDGSPERKQYNHIAVYVNDEELARVDALRGESPRSVYAKQVLQRQGNNRIIVTSSRGTFYLKRSRFEIWLYLSSFSDATLDLQRIEFRMGSRGGDEIAHPQTLKLAPDMPNGAAQLIVVWNLTDAQTRSLMEFFPIAPDCQVFHYAEMQITLKGKITFADKNLPNYEISTNVFFMLENRF